MAAAAHPDRAGLAAPVGTQAVDRAALLLVAVLDSPEPVASADLVAASEFFAGMGFEVADTDDTSMRVANAGGVTVVLVAGDHNPAVHRRLAEHGSGVQHIAIEVLNASFTRDALDEAGVPRLTDVVVDEAGHEQVFTVTDPATGVQLSFISRTGHRVPMGSHNVRAMFEAIDRATREG